MLILCASLFVLCVVVGFCFVFNLHSMPLIFSTFQRNLWVWGGGGGVNFAGCRFLAVYTYTILSLRRWVGVCRNTSYTSPSQSRWVGVSLHIYLYIVFSESLGWGFSPYILIYRL